MLYLVQVTVYSALLYLIYLAILKNRASHDLNRIYLLLCAALPLVIPFIRIPGLYNIVPAYTGAINTLLPGITVFAKKQQALELTFPRNVFTSLYLSVSIAMLCRLVYQYLTFKRFIKQNKIEVIDNVQVLLDTKSGPGSFWNYLFLPGNKIDPQIFEHELAHIRLRHSIDILFIRLLQTVTWANIVLIMILRELMIVHEFQADAHAVENKESYIHTLLNDTFGTHHFSLSHTFFYHSLKRRIMMLNKSPLSRTKLRITMLKTGVSALLIVAAIIYMQSCKQETKTDLNQVTTEFVTSPDTSKPKMITERTDLPKPKVVTTALDTFKKIHITGDNLSMKIKNPQHPGVKTGDDVVSAGSNAISGHGEVFNSAEVPPRAEFDYQAFLNENIVYPEYAKNKKIEGKVIVKFVVDETGAIIQPEIVRSPDEVLSDETLRVIRKMPKWIPGETGGKKVAVLFYLPVVFKL